MGQLVESLRRFEVKAVRICAAILLAIAVIVVIAIDGSGDGGSPTPAPSEESAVLTESALFVRAAQVGHPLYWLGVRPGTQRYEMTNTAEGAEIYLRYLPEGRGAGDSPKDLVTVGTYQVADARQALRRARASEGNTMTLSTRPDYEVLASGSSHSAYVVFDEQPELQIEVYSPTPGEASRLVEDGALKPVG